MFEDMHDKNSGHKSKEICYETRVEVRPLIFIYTENINNIKIIYLKLFNTAGYPWHPMA